MEYKIECSSQEEFDRLKVRATKCKVVLLDIWKESPLANPSSFVPRKKDKFLREYHEMMMSWEDDRLDTEFNDIVNRDILAREYTTIPVKHYTPPDLNEVIPKKEEGEPAIEPQLTPSCGETDDKPDLVL